MFDTAVVCTDLTSDSDALVRCAGGLGVLGVRQAVLTHVVDIFHDPQGATMRGREAEDTFERQCSDLERSGYNVRVEAAVGHPAHAVDEVRRRHSAALIVVGSHGRGIFGQSRPGTLDAGELHASGTPIFVASLDPEIDPGASEVVGSRVLGKVLLCTDLSASSEHAFMQARALARLGAREFVVAHVIGAAGPAMQGGDHTRAERLAQMRETLLDAGAETVEVLVLYGSPAEELSRQAASGEFTLVVLGGARGGRYGGLTGHVGDRVMQDARTPVLLVPARNTTGGPGA